MSNIELSEGNPIDSTQHDSRRVLLLETDERSGLVAAIAAACHSKNVSLEITTGPSHVLLTFEADEQTTDATVLALSDVAGVSSVHRYTVMCVPKELTEG